MKSLKKMLCLLMAIAVVVGSLGLVTSIAAGAETDDAKYFLKFSQEVLDSAKRLSNDDMKTEAYFNEPNLPDEFVKSSAKSGMEVKMNEGSSSISMVKNSVSDGEDYQFGTNIEIPVTDEMRENYLKATDKKLFISFWVSDCSRTDSTYKGLYTDCQLRIYTKFKTAYKDFNKDKTAYTNRYMKLASLGKGAYRMNQQVKNKAFKLLDGEDNALENLNDVESIIISLYSYTKNVQLSMNVSGIAYEGEPEIVKYVEPTPGAKKSYATFTDWQKFYDKGFTNTPQTLKYYSKGGYDDSLYKSAKSDKWPDAGFGWVYYNNTVKVAEWQLNTVYDVDPVAFNQALATANQPGGEGKIKLTCKFPKIEDTDGKSMQAEFQVRINTYSGESIELVQQFIDPGKEYTFEMSSRDIEYNSIASVRIALMAFWQYDEEYEVYYDTGKDQFAKRYDKDGNLMTPVYEKDSAGKDVFMGYSIEGSDTLLQDKDVVKITTACSDGRKNVVIKDDAKGIDIIGRLKSRTMQNVESFVSPLYTGELPKGDVSGTTTTAGSTTVSEYKYAGEHFFDFKSEQYAETYGAYTHASFANYLFDDYYDSCEIKDYNLSKDGILQGFADRNNPIKKVDCSTDATYKSEFEQAKSLPSGGYQVELNSPYPRRQEQHQAYFCASGKVEDERMEQDGGDHKGQKGQGETYDYQKQMATALQHALDNPNPTQAGYLAVDIYIKNAVHGYKNTYDKFLRSGKSLSTYKEWCKKNGKDCKNENSPVQVIVGILAKTPDGTSLNAKVMEMVDFGVKKTLYIDVSELTPDCIFQGVSVAAQNYSHLANREQGGDNLSCGITDVQVRYSALYIPGSANTDLTTTADVTEPLDEKEALKLKQLYDALPGLSVDDYETEEDYQKLADFVKAWSKASILTQKYCEEKYGIDYAEIGMLEQDVYEKFYGSGAEDGDNGYGDDDDEYSSDTGDFAFPMVALLIAGLSGYVVLKTRKRKS